MKIKPIKTNKDHKAALKRIDAFLGSKPDPTAGDELDVLITLVESYEQKHFAIGPPDLIEAIKFRMDQLGLKQADIALAVGGKNRASELLNRKRPLTASMMKQLHKKFNIPAELIILNIPNFSAYSF